VIQRLAPAHCENWGVSSPFGFIIMAQDRPPHAARSRYYVTAVLVLAALLLGVWAVATRWKSAGPTAHRADTPQDPRLAYTGPFQNLHPKVAYVGDEACARCHEDIAQTYRRHPMGRSLQPMASVAGQQSYEADTHNPFEALGTLFLAERRGAQVFHRQLGRDERGQTVYASEEPVDYVLGSGTHGYSYLSDRGGYVYQTPISWYSQKHIWDVSPGFGIELRAGRAISGACLYCHANQSRPQPNYVNRFEEPLFEGYAIGCERCHGPGGAHVQDPGHKTDGVDLTIVNPRFLTHQERSAICEQCHLAGSARVLRRGRVENDYRPGLLLEMCWSVFVPETNPNGPREAIGHVEQMYLSKCYLGSKEVPPSKSGERGQRKLGCTSCHDPHRIVEPRNQTAWYRAKCLECHTEQSCLEVEDVRQARHDSCIECHMPRYTAVDIAHTASIDHRIVRRPEVAKATRGDSAGGAPRLVPVHPDHYNRDDADLKRDLGLAYVRLFTTRKATPGRDDEAIVSWLESAVESDPDDVEALESKAMALSLFQRSTEALAAFQAVLDKVPQREASLAGAAYLAQQQQRTELALTYWKRAVAENPHEARYRDHLTRLLVDQKDWRAARPHCEVWLRLDPSNLDARVLWVRCLLHTGDKKTAEAEFEKIRRLRPPNLPLLEARFLVELRNQ
jgi:hypothetical protein